MGLTRPTLTYYYLFHIMPSGQTAVTEKAISILFFASKDLMKNPESNSLYRLVSIAKKHKKNKTVGEAIKPTVQQEGFLSAKILYY